MKKSVKRVLSAVVGLSAFLCVSSTSFAATVPDKKIGIELEFDKQKYYCGEIANVELKLTGVEDERSANYSIGSIQANIKFSNMTFMDTSAFDEALGITDSNATSYLTPTGNYKDTILAFYDANDSVGISFGEEGDLTLANLQFKVNDDIKNVSVEFNNAYNVVAMRPNGLGISFDDRFYEVTVGNKKEATASDYVLNIANAEISGTTVTSTISVDSAKTDNVKVIAGLYKKNDKLLLAPVVMKTIGVDDQPYTVTFNNINDSENLQIRYFLWTNTTVLWPLAPRTDIDVTVK